MYEIKSVGGKILYVAKDAKDVSEALTEAVSNGANLTEANLTRANLYRASLNGANLYRANLTRANLYRASLNGASLTGANLTEANLTRANLTEANLTRANLTEANLTRANLTEAYLDGASLYGASLDGNIWQEVATKLETSLQAMNDNGRHWIKGELSREIEDGSTAYCSIGSVRANSDGTVQTVALWLLNSVCAGPIERFNDHPDTTWEDVQAVFAVAISHARRFAAK